MEKKLWLLLILAFGNIPSLYAARGERKALEVSPYYLQLKSEVELLKSYWYAWEGTKNKVMASLVYRAWGAAPRIEENIESFQENLDKASNEQEMYKVFRESWPSAKYALSQSALTVLVVGTLGAVWGERERRSILNHINRALVQNKTGYDFAKLPLDEAMVVLAAYKKDAYMMRKLKPFVRHFLEKPEVLQALAQLYFFKSSWWRRSTLGYSPENVEKLKAMLE